MSDGTYNRESKIEATKATARLPGLDIEIIHRQSPNSEWEQVSINVRATPSFEMLGRSFEVADPFTLWMQAVSLMWMPWMVTAQTMMLPNRWPQLPNFILPQQEARMSLQKPLRRHTFDAENPVIQNVRRPPIEHDPVADCTM